MPICSSSVRSKTVLNFIHRAVGKSTLYMLIKPSATGEQTIVNNDLTQAPATVTKLSSTVLTRLIIQHKLAKTDLAHSVCSMHAHTQ